MKRLFGFLLQTNCLVMKTWKPVKVNLKPEKSDNLNLSFSYNYQFGKHGVYAEAGLIYRDTKDYIKRGLDVLGGTSYGYYENHGHVRTKGYNLSLLFIASRTGSM